MALPNPLPDNPLRWDGWKNYNSDNFYTRLCLSEEDHATTQAIEDNCRQLLVWWQKKLPLKNQPSNPLSQLLRGGLDEAPVFLVEARTELLNPESRARIDAELHVRAVDKGVDDFKRFLEYALVDKTLSAESEAHLLNAGKGLGLSVEVMQEVVLSELKRLGAVRLERVVPIPVVEPPAAVAAPIAPSVVAMDKFAEFRRMLSYSRLGLDGDDMTDDQRDALCNIGESLGLSGGEAEDLIDEYLDQASGLPPLPSTAAVARTPVAKAPVAKPAPVLSKAMAAPAPPPRLPAITPLMRSAERQQHPNFVNSIGLEMLLVTSGSFLMGSNATDGAANAQPVTPVTISCLFMGRFPITNAQYEEFDPSHRSLRAPWADGQHPVVYVNSLQAEKFCEWLSRHEGRKYRLPTEAEWEYAARGLQNRVYPWGDRLDAGFYANFADRRTTFAWRNPDIDDGFAQSAPIGSYPRGVSAFGIEELSGNVFEWCLDFFEPYKGKERLNPRGPIQGVKRNCRGGSWKSRAGSLCGWARHFNLPEYTSNDVGFRVVCECG
ncbi:MAG: hypothetical protein JWL59_460 [Chthoniobacteraceae bacterium]|nr:hypothetical protein [Chthoniobacteraceae bacterium]